MDQEVTGWGRSWSSGVCSSALPVPLLVTVTVNPMASPAETEALSADLATSMAAPRTSTEAEAVSDPSLVVVTLAVLSTRAEVHTAELESRPPCAYCLELADKT